MKRKSLAFVMLLAITFFAFSCKKKEDPKDQPKTTKELLIGKWNCIKDAEDVNDNGTMDASEVNILGNDRQYQFDNDGNAARTIYDSQGNPIIDNYTWTLDGTSLYLDDKNSTWMDTFYIDAISTSEMTFRYNDRFTHRRLNWKMFNKL